MGVAAQAPISSQTLRSLPSLSDQSFSMLRSFRFFTISAWGLPQYKLSSQAEIRFVVRTAEQLSVPPSGAAPICLECDAKQFILRKFEGKRMFNSAAKTEPLESSMSWIVGILASEVVVALSVIAIALVGFSMLSGRLSIRRSVQVILGCFLLVGAPTIASEMIGWIGTGEANRTPPLVVYEQAPRSPLAEATYDPYAGASLRRPVGTSGEQSERE